MTLDANGGFFENERDDLLSEDVEKTEILNKVITQGEVVTSFPVYEEDGVSKAFAGWSLERDGELVAIGFEEYIPTDNCVLYAVWDAPESDDTVEQDVKSTDFEADSQSTDFEEENKEESNEEQLLTDSGDFSENTEEDALFAETEPDPDSTEDTDAADYEDEEDPVQTAAGITEEKEEDYTAEDDQAAVRTDSERKSLASGEAIETDESPDASIDQLREDEGDKLVESSVEEEETNADAAGAAAETTVNGTCGENAKWSLDSEGTMTISGSGEIDTFHKPYEASFSSDVRYNTKKIVIKSGITSITYRAFREFSNLREVFIPDSVTRIGSNIFYYCGELKTVRLPKKVEAFAEDAFDKAKYIEELAIPEGCTKLDIDLRSSSLKSLRLPSTLTLLSLFTYENKIEDNLSEVYYAGSFDDWCNLKTYDVPLITDNRSPYLWNINARDYFKSRKDRTKVRFGKLAANSITAENIVLYGSPAKQQASIKASALHGSISYSSNNSSITVNDKGKITVKANYIGKATITLTASQKYFKTATKKITVTVKKATPTITASNKTRTASVKKQTFKIGAKTTGGKLSYKSNTKGISVNSSGTVTVGAKFVGKGTITITSAPGNAFYKAVKKITVTVKKQAPTITAKNIKKYVAKSAKTYDLGAKSSINGKLQYKSNNKNITVNSAGKITVKKNYGGKATITISMPATAIRKAASKKITVSVVKRNNPITASSITTYYASGKKILDIGAYAKGKTKLTYSSDNSYIKVSQKGVVTVSAGYVGKATITIKTSGNTYYKASSKKITVTVKDSVPGTGSGSGGSSGGSSLARECQQCNGTGICPICNGTGGHYYGNPLKWSACLSCGGKTTCHYCGGDGIKDN